MKNLMKITVAGGIVFGIWFALLVLFPKPEAPIQEADADVFSFDFAKQGDQERFVEVLQDQGLEEPRVYDWNGNTMFFSTTTTNETPKQVLARFQRAFVEKGVNKRVHLDAVKDFMPNPPKSMKDAVSRKDEALASRALMDDFFGGGVLPTHVSQQQVFMVGMTSEGDARSSEEFMDELTTRIKKYGKAKGGTTLTNSVKAMRFVEAFRTNTGETRITATWSDEKLDMNKIANKGEDLGVDPDLPGCIGCSRLNSFQGQTKGEEDFGVTVFNGNRQSVDQVMSFYTRSLTNRGWLPTESSKVMVDAKNANFMPDNGSEMINFAKDGKFLTLLVHRTDSGETKVHLVESD